MATATEKLGQLIVLAVPYAAEVPPNPFPLPIEPSGYPAGLERRFGFCLDEVEAQAYSGNWDFRGAPRHIESAIRVPYMYYRASTNTSAGAAASFLVKDYLLIGFEGAGGGG